MASWRRLHRRVSKLLDAEVKRTDREDKDIVNNQRREHAERHWMGQQSVVVRRLVSRIQKVLDANEPSVD